MSKNNIKRILICSLLGFSLLVALKPTNAHAGLVAGGGGSNPGGGGANEGSCGGSTGIVCPMTLWVYYTINDRSRPAYIGSHAPYASSITISDCGPYGGFWIYQRTANEAGDKGTAKYRVASGARQRSSWLNGNATSSTMIPLKGVWNDENSNVTPQIPGYPDCASNKTCGKDGSWPVSDATVQGYFRENNGGSTYCTIGSYSGDCFGSNSPLTYFCYGDDPEREFTHSLSYNKNTTDSVSGMPSGTSCSCTTTNSSCSCNVTVSSNTPTRANYAFAGWNTRSDGSGTNKSAGNWSISNDKTLYAKWQQYTHTLKYDACAGSKPSGKLGNNTVSDGSTSHTFTISSDRPTPPTGYKFIGWSTVSCDGAKNKNPGDTISVGNETKTLYAKYQAYTIATFTAPEITITSSELSNISGNNWKGLGNKTSYAVTATYHVKRTNDTPASATSNYGTRGAASDDNVYPSNGTASNALTNTQQQDIPTSYTVAVDNGSTAAACFYFKYDSKVYYDGTTRVGSAETSTTKKCISVYNPAKNNASFTGSVSISNGDGLSGTSTSRTGSGYKSTFTVTPSYAITRTDGLTTPTTASSDYAINATSAAYNANSYPADTATKANTGALGIAATDKTKSWSGSASTVNIDIGSSAQNRCFYLRYDTSVLYYDNDRYSGNFAGKTYDCVSITNPANTTSISFTGNTTNGTITANDRVIRSDSNRVGTLNNHDRTTTGNDDVVGEWVDNTTVINGTYTADFSHSITRSDASATILGKTMNASVSWKVQEIFPATAPSWNASAGTWTVPTTSTANWTDYATSRDNKSSSVSGTASLGASGSTTITTQPKLTATHGQIRYYCQRLLYTPTTNYTTYTIDDRNDYGVKISSYATATATSPLCVTLKNPVWSETDSTILPHLIDVTPTIGNTEYAANTFSQSGNAHETLVVNPTIYVHHSVSRSDNKNAPESYDESDANYNGNVLFGSGANKKFWQSSIYSQTACTSKYWGTNSSNQNARAIDGKCKVITNLSGYERIVGFDASAALVPVMGGRSTDGALAIQLGATSKTAGDTWNSTKTSGASRLNFNATGLNKYSIMAGQTREFTIHSSVRHTRWTYNYKKINLHEYYTKNGTVTERIAGATTFDRIEKVQSTTSSPNPAPATNPAHLESSPVTFSVTRPYNFKITDAAYSSDASGSGGYITYDDDNLQVNFTINIGKENNTHAYITDPNHTTNSRYVYPVTYVIPASTSASTINGNASGVHSGVESDICAHFNGIAKAGSCSLHTESAQPNKLSAVAGATTFNPNSTPTGAVVDTIFRHVYDATSYTLSYRTGTIKVQNADGSPLGAGEKFCVAIAIKNYSSASNAYFVSSSTCRNVSKRPSFQAWGGSVITDGGIDTSESTYANKRFGSWADFAITANKEVKRMNSGASTISGIATSSSICNRSPLTIANQNCDRSEKTLGYASIDARGSFIEKVLSYFTSNATLNDLSSRSDGKGTVPNRTYIIRNENSDFTIDTNIYNDYADSQIIIIAKNINIKSNVTRVDALLIATGVNNAGGTIDTCSNIADSALSARNCTNMLKVNGQLVAGNIKFKRTSGGDPATNSLTNPAELTNYAPSTIIWGGHKSMSEANPRTVFVHKIPTRF
ncbi:InlB B-repeat-containing protein [Candidatus Saccharibacteria bacterium]|nr:InlB B-repeat-containing protein [Candidatus Saccharibacteria bacterium]